jgi:nitroimidazol reductase NimA-like FMN-containing flavoprotein (pyridoxamine 5'-phosphate oxidase superfamily)
MQLTVQTNSDWALAEIEQFLMSENIPMRIAVMDADGFPMICSVWHQYQQGKIYAVVHKNSKLIKKLRQSPQCAFEIALNHPPYRGVRGQAVASIDEQDAAGPLDELLNRFVGEGYQQLRTFLRQRSADERVVTLALGKISAWDFSARMQA